MLTDDLLYPKQILPEYAFVVEGERGFDTVVYLQRKKLETIATMA